MPKAGSEYLKKDKLIKPGMIAMSKERFVALFKLGEKKYMEELLHEGHVYMNTIEHFAKLDASSPRHDRDEGTRFCKNADGATLKMEDEGTWHSIGAITGAMRFYDKDLAATNVYSLHGKTQNDYGLVFEPKQLGFGDSYVLFLDGNEFFRRLELAVGRAGHRLRWNRIEYVNRCTYTGPMGEFKKFAERSAEQEVRVAIRAGTGRPLSFRLGNLSDIALIGCANERLRLEPKETLRGSSPSKF